MNVAAWPGALTRAALDLVLPPACLACDEAVDADGRLCPDCFRRLGFITDPLCRCCGAPFGAVAEGGRAGLCQDCVERPPAFHRARAALRYDAHSRRLVLPFKHADRTERALGLARLMARAGAQLLAEPCVLVPVPLHRRRLLARRYNQAALLARALGRLTRQPVMPDALRRVRATEPLGTHARDMRRQIMHGAIAARLSRATLLRGRRVVLIDDVFTTGATADACAHALRAVGVSQVDLLVTARVCREHDAEPRQPGL